MESVRTLPIYASAVSLNSAFVKTGTTVLLNLFKLSTSLRLHLQALKDKFIASNSD